jgi:hypothetical protein
VLTSFGFGIDSKINRLAAQAKSRYANLINPMKKILIVAVILTLLTSCKSNWLLTNNFEETGFHEEAISVYYVDQIPDDTYRFHSSLGDSDKLRNTIKSYFEQSNRFNLIEDENYPKKLMVRDYYEFKGHGTAYFISMLFLGLLPLSIYDQIDLTYSLLDEENQSEMIFENRIVLREKFSIYERFREGTPREKLISKSITLEEPKRVINSDN